MKKVITLSLVFILLLQCSMKLAIVVSYHINKDYITANFCENKARPQMKCNGKCYLAKKIQAEEKQEQTLPSVLKGLHDIVLFYQVNTFSLEISSFSILIRNYSLYLLKQYVSPLSGILQPPQ
ncbi:MAG TPA: hypothetical protein VK750_03125 [Cytophagaceae bacterium]|nr:hypothetical protein [Cytophagaceae bacterium]